MSQYQSLAPDEPSEPETGTTRAILCSDRNQTEPRPAWILQNVRTLEIQCRFVSSSAKHQGPQGRLAAHAAVTCTHALTTASNSSSSSSSSNFVGNSTNSAASGSRGSGGDLRIAFLRCPGSEVLGDTAVHTLVRVPCNIVSKELEDCFAQRDCPCLR